VKIHFLALDGLRGVASLAVVISHVTAYTAGETALSHAFLAVDFFFVLSGFVIAHAYEQRLLSDMRLGQFAKLRIVRLWPLIIAGLALGAFYLAVKDHLRPGEAVGASYIATAFAFGLILFPLNTVVGTQGYPLDPPCWSLFFEVAANGLYALLCRLRLISQAVLVTIIACSLLGLIAESRFKVWDSPLNVPNRLALFLSFLEGFSRVGFGFFVGVLLYRHRNNKVLLRIPALHPGIASVLLLALFAAPPFSTNAYDLVVGALVLPSIVAASVHYQPRGRGDTLCRFSGWLSYPLYVVHYPLLFSIAGVAKIIGGSGRMPVALIQAVSILSCLVFAFFIGKFYDEPAREWLGKVVRARFSGLHVPGG